MEGDGEVVWYNGWVNPNPINYGVTGSGNDQIQHTTIIMYDILNVLLETETIKKVAECCGICIGLVLTVQIKITNKQQVWLYGHMRADSVHQEKTLVV